MKKVSLVGVILAIGLLISLKLIGVGNSMLRISDPLTNTIVIIAFIIFVLIYGVSHL